MVGSNGSIAGTLLSYDSENLELLDPVEGEREAPCLMISDGGGVLPGEVLPPHWGLMARVGLCCWIPVDMTGERYGADVGKRLW